MNKLEKDLWEAMGNYLPHEEEVKAAVSVAMKWIENAFEAGMSFSYDQTMSNGKRALNYNDWLIFNGLTPTEPDTKEPVNGGTIESPMPALYNQAQRTIPGEIYTIGSNGIINGEYKEDV